MRSIDLTGGLGVAASLGAAVVLCGCGTNETAQKHSRHFDMSRLSVRAEPAQAAVIASPPPNITQDNVDEALAWFRQPPGDAPGEPSSDMDGLSAYERGAASVESPTDLEAAIAWLGKPTQGEVEAALKQIRAFTQEDLDAALRWLQAGDMSARGVPSGAGQQVRGFVERVGELRQAHDNWCWAACDEAIARTFGVALTQQQVACDRKKCEDVPGTDSDFAEPLRSALEQSGWQGSINTSVLPLSDDAIASAIDANDPIAVSIDPDWDPATGPNHLVVIYGYARSLDHFLLLVWDPNRGYVTLDSNYVRGAWVSSHVVALID